MVFFLDGIPFLYPHLLTIVARALWAIQGLLDNFPPSPCRPAALFSRERRDQQTHLRHDPGLKWSLHSIGQGWESQSAGTR